jgi:hypothetical protein
MTRLERLAQRIHKEVKVPLTMARRMAKRLIELADKWK